MISNLGDLVAKPVVTTKSGFGRAFQKSRESSLTFSALLAAFDALRYFCGAAPAISHERLYFNAEPDFPVGDFRKPSFNRGLVSAMAFKT